MCDYSLTFVTSRPARAGDKLISARFNNSFTRGFAELGVPEVVVCLLAGTELAFEHVVGFREGSTPNLMVSEQTVARFRQVDMDKPKVHHDALEFPNGKIVLLHNLADGQQATVLQLPATVGEPGARGAALGQERAPRPLQAS